jgi:hypothetical protein
MLLLGCLLPEPPEYERRTTPPFLWAPDPTTTKILSVVGGGSIAKFNVLVRSEDAPGDNLLAILYLNYRIEGKEELQPNPVEIPAGTLSDPPRVIDIRWRPPVKVPGSCEQLSLLVTHKSNLDSDLPIRDDDVAVLTWWVAIKESAEASVLCPSGAEGNP